MNWKQISENIILMNHHIRSKKNQLTIQQRLKAILIEFPQLLEQLSGEPEAKTYIQNRKKEDHKLKKIQTKVQKDAIKFLDNKNIIPASSFSAGTNLIGESDLDFAVLVDNLDDETLMIYSNLFGLHGFQFTEIRQKGNIGVHYVFQKYVDGVEIEMKLRDKKYFMSFLYHIHHFNDHVLSKKDKETITWIKYNLKNNSKEAYDAFKSLYYDFASASSGMKQLLYPLQD